MSPKMGQKLTDNPKDKRIQIRMDSETLDKLDCLVAEQNSDRSKIIRQGIEIKYEKREKEKPYQVWRPERLLNHHNTPKRLIYLLYLPLV